MSFNTTAAARQNEMNDNIAVVAMSTLGMEGLTDFLTGWSVDVAMIEPRSHTLRPKNKTAMEDDPVHGRRWLNHALPRYADGVS
jgi:hypothetical protein